VGLAYGNEPKPIIKSDKPDNAYCKKRKYMEMQDLKIFQIITASNSKV